MIDLIISILRDINSNATVELASLFEADIDSFRLPESELPFVVIDNEFDIPTRIGENRCKIKTYNYVISFMDMDNPDNTDYERNDIIESMTVYADTFVSQLYKVVGITINTYTLTPIYNYFNSILSGVSIRLSFESIEEQNYCLPE